MGWFGELKEEPGGLKDDLDEQLSDPKWGSCGACVT